MQQKQLTLLKNPLLMTALILGIGFDCKKNDDITPQPVIIKELLGFIPIEGGTFNMGSTLGTGAANEHPQHQITLSAFYLDSTELTRGNFLPFYNPKTPAI